MIEKSINKIRNREGEIIQFNEKTFVDSIYKSLIVTERGISKSQLTLDGAPYSIIQAHKQLAKELARKTLVILRERYGEYTIPAVEDLQDTAEQVLIEAGHTPAARAYMLHREMDRQAQRAESTFMNVQKTTDDYIKKIDWMVKENSNIPYSYSGLQMYTVGAVMANYTLENIYPQKIRAAHRNGDIHIHDLSMGIAPYCAGWSIRQLLEEGFNGVPGKIDCKPASHMDTAIGQIINFMGTLQNEWGGAMALNSFDTYLAPFARADNLDYKAIKQNIQQFVFNMNIPSRWGGQTPFSNITLDWTVPPDLKDQPVIIGGKRQESTFAEYEKEMNLINRAFIEVLTAGDASGRVFTFPIPTYNLTKDFDWESENAKLLFEMVAKFGLPYFQNFINSDLKPSDVRAMCCRLQIDLKELRNKTGGLFGSGESTGSVGVVTINLPRLGYLSKTKEEFLNKLGLLMELAKESLEIKRNVVQRNIDTGLLPFTKRYLGNLHNHFSTIGLIGMNEANLNFLNKDISTEEGRIFALEVLNFMRKKLSEFQEETTHIYNLEATPGEGTSYRFAKIDKKLYPNIISSGKKVSYYTNSTQLPVGYTDDIFEALNLQEELQTKYTGGTVFHAFLGERISDGEACKLLVKRIATKFKIPYFTITPTFSICREHGYLSGEQFSCSICGQQTEVYSRVVGYYRPIQNWNEGKQEEYRDRKVFRLKGSFDKSHGN